jgi:oligoendopeptidase F
LPYYPQRESPIEFAEVASMSMELLAGPHLAEKRGGFYTDEDATRARVEHLESVIRFWPYMAVVDAFQHWVYENPAEAKNPSACDEEWDRLSRKFLPAVDWSGLEEIRKTGWHRKLHIHTVPFYYVEYGLAQLGAVLVWKNSLTNFEKALADYRRALALGGIVPLPALYETAGARLAMDRQALSEAVQLVEETLEELESNEK